MRSLILSTAALIFPAGLMVAALMQPAAAGTVPDYQFERYWPALQQPWYFRDSAGFVGPDGFIYVAESAQRAVRKFSRDGQLVSVFAPPGGLPKGLDFDAEGNVYVAMQGGDGVVKYSADGRLIAAFENPGFGLAADLAVTTNRVFVADLAASFFQPEGSPALHEFDLDGRLIRSFTDLITDTGQLTSVSTIAWHPDQGLVLRDSADNRLHRFETDGTFIESISADPGLGGGNIRRIRFDADGKLYLAAGNNALILDTDFGLQTALPVTDGITTPVKSYSVLSPFDDGNILTTDASIALSVMSPQGNILSRYAAESGANGRFEFPYDIAVNDNFIYVLEAFVGNRLQQFDRQGQFIRTIGDGILGFPLGIALDPQGDIHVSGRFDNAIFEFDSLGNLLSTHPTAFTEPARLDIDSAGNRVISFYALGSAPSFIEILSPTGEQLDTWSVLDATDDRIENLHITDNDEVWMINTEFESLGPNSGRNISREIARYDLAGNRLGGWTTTDFYNAITVSDSGDVLLGGQGSIKVFDQNGNLQREVGEQGFQAGGFLFHSGLALGSDGRLMAVDPDNRRVQIFASQLPEVETRAIVVAGGGPYPGNALWPATELNATFAYRTLLFQGLGKDAIEYLSNNIELDVDQNGIADDVDDVASNASLRESLLGPSGNGSDGFAAGAAHLVLYMVDHGGLDTFRMSDTEITASSQVAQWVDGWQAANPGSRLTIIYDACQSGSFMDELSNPDFAPRHVITSSGASENAYFVSQGTLSFSNHFWTHIFNGLSVGQAYDLARTSTSSTFPGQTPQMDADGDGLANTPADAGQVAALVIGNGTGASGSRPVIGAVDTGAQPVLSGNSATITASAVTDDEGVARVWAVLRPPGFNPGSPDNPIRDLPTFELLPAGADQFVATYDRFDEIGTYQLTINALDDLGNSAVPMAAQVSIQSPLKRRAIVIAGGQPGDNALPLNLSLAELALQALTQQGYGGQGSGCQSSSCDDIQLLVDAGVAGQDGTPVLGNIQSAITIWGVDGVQDLTVYIIGEREAGGIRLTGGEVLSPASLDSWLTSARAQLSGVLTLIVDADDAGGFAGQLTPAAGQYVIASAGPGRNAAFIDQGAVSFTRFFWGQVLNGANVGPAFRLARAALNFSAAGPSPELDDDGDGVPNQFSDGIASNRYAIGTGVLLAGDEPLIGSLQISNPLTQRAEPIVISNVASTGTVLQGIAVITQPNGHVVVDNLRPQEADQGTAFSNPRSSGLCSGPGSYTVTAYAIDEEGLSSQPITAVTHRTEACSSFLFFDSFE